MTPDEAKRKQAATALAARDRWAEQVWTSSLKPLERLVALAYADHARDGLHSVWLSIDRLRERTGLSRDAAHRALRGLETAGWLRVVQPARQHRSTRYALDVPSSTTDLDPACFLDQQSVSRTPEQSVSRTPERSSSPSPDTSSPSPDTSSPSPGPDFPSYYPSHHQSGSDGERADARTAALAAGVRGDLVDRFLVHAFAAKDTKKTVAGRISGDHSWRLACVERARADRRRDVEREVARLTAQSEPVCDDGKPGGGNRHPLHDTFLCPLCAARERTAGRLTVVAS